MRRIQIVAGLAVASLVTLGVLAPAAEAAAPPKITSLTTSPSTLSAAGGTLLVNAAVTDASTCVFTTTPDLGSSPAPVSCTNGAFTRSVTIPANTSSTDPKSYTVSLKAQSAAGFQTRTLTLIQPEKRVPGPTISSLTVSPSSLTSAGGTVTINASITNGAMCKFTTDAALGGGTTTSSCTTSFSSTQSVPANASTTTSKNYTFSLEVDNESGAATGSAGVVVPPASSPAPAITNLAASPTTFTSSGGAVSFSATVSNATSCAFTAPASLEGGTTTSNCSGGAFSASSNLPANTDTDAQTYQFLLKATGPGGTATQSISLVVPPPSAAAPAISELSVSPSSFTSGGGAATVRASIMRATMCTFTVPASLGGTSTRSNCANGTFLRRVTLPANTSGAAQTYQFTLKATGTGGSATATITVTVPAAGPSVGALSINPNNLPAAGGSLTVSGTVSGASTCTFTSNPATLGLSTAPFDCSAGGVVSRSVDVPANTTESARTFTFTLTANGAGGGSAGRSIILTQNPVPPTVTPLASSRSSIPAGGATFTLRSTVSNATSCVFSSSPDVGIDESSFACDGSVSRSVTVPANTTGRTRSFDFGLTASGPGGTAGRGRTLSQPSRASQAARAAVPTATVLAFSPAALTSDGGRLVVSSTVTGASSCLFSVDPVVPGGGRKACTNGRVAVAFTIPANTTTGERSYLFTLVVTGPGGKVTRTYGLTQPAPGPAEPTADKLSFSPATLSADGGKLTVSSSVTGATSCQFSSSPKIPGGRTKPCTSGRVNSVFTVPANTTGSARTYTFTLLVSGRGGKFTRAFDLMQPAATPPAPTAAKLTFSPTALTADGGALTVSSSVTRATTCEFSSSPVIAGGGSKACTDGPVSSVFTVPANTTGSGRVFTFSLKVTGPGGKLTRAFDLYQPAATG